MIPPSRVTKTQHRPTGGTWTAWTSISGSSASTTEHTLTLPKAEEYEFGVRAVTGAEQGAAATVIKAPLALFDPSTTYEIQTLYHKTTTIDVSSYLGAGVSGGEVTFTMKDCGSDSGDYYKSLTLTGSELVAVVNDQGHAHASTGPYTTCTVTGSVPVGAGAAMKRRRLSCT